MTGRPKSEPDADLTERITITLPRSLLAAIDAAGSNRSATIARIIAEWMQKCKSRQIEK